MDNNRKLMLISELLSSSSDSSDDEILPYLINQRRRPRITNFIDVIHQYNEEEFRRHFRIVLPTFNFLADAFKSSDFYPQRQLRNDGGKPNISPDVHIYLFLWFAGNKSTLREVSHLFNVSESTAFIICQRVMDFLTSIGKDIIKFPSTEEEKVAVSAEFEMISGFPNVIGCVDGSYINIRTPSHKIKSTYTNRHHQTAVTLQGICDKKKKFLNAFTGVPSKMHDSKVFSLSFIKRTIEAMDGRYHLLGDAAYPICPYLLTPYRDYGNLTPEKTNFNLKLSQTRVVIENAFGLLKNRFRQLMSVDFHTVTKISKFILSCCVLHNLCIDKEDFWEEENAVNDEGETPDQPRDLLRALGEQKRDELAEILFNIR